MDEVRRRRPDVRITVNDLSEDATTSASRTFGFETIAGDAHALAKHAVTYDLLVLSDVLYYISDIASFWPVVQRLLRPGGILLIRVPNKLAVIRLGRMLARVRTRLLKEPLEDRVKSFNPEHVYIFSRSYLEQRLSSLGFPQVQVIPSPPLGNPSLALNVLSAGAFRFAKAVNRVSLGYLLPSPSMIVIGRYRE